MYIYVDWYICVYNSYIHIYSWIDFERLLFRYTADIFCGRAVGVCTSLWAETPNGNNDIGCPIVYIGERETRLHFAWRFRGHKWTKMGGERQKKWARLPDANFFRETKNCLPTSLLSFVPWKPKRTTWIHLKFIRALESIFENNFSVIVKYCVD